MEKSCRKYANASPGPRYLLNNSKQPLHARCLLKVRYFERGLTKSLKKGNFIFSFEHSPFQ